jgi:putative membrane protein
MPSEHRLHPSSIVFSFAGQLKNFAVPAILVLFGVRGSGGDWEQWLALLLIPNTLVAVLRYLSFRYRYEETELIIRSGLVFKNERHVPYARIQNLDAVQNIGHRLLNVVEVRVETGAGQEPEAVMSAVPQAAYEEMRRRVFGRERSVAKPDEVVEGSPAEATHTTRTLLHLSPRELMICGLIENRGAVLIAAGLGVLWEAGIADRVFGQIFGEGSMGRGMIRDMVVSFFRGTVAWVPRLALAAGALAGILIGSRILSLVWAVIRLHDFTLTRTGDDLRIQYGLLTRVAATVPLRKIQSITVRQGPLQQLFSRVAIRVDTAGGESKETAASERAWLAPIITPEAGLQLLREILPEIDAQTFDWHPIHPRAYRRLSRLSIWIALVVSLGTVYWVGWWSGVAFAVLTVWGMTDARQYVRHAQWATTASLVTFRRGWIFKHWTLVRFAKMQVVGLHETPFDRRHHMASVSVDTAGAERNQALHIPYLGRAEARDLHAGLAKEAARSEFTW